MRKSRSFSSFTMNRSKPPPLRVPPECLSSPSDLKPLESSMVSGFWCEVKLWWLQWWLRRQVRNRALRGAIKQILFFFLSICWIFLGTWRNECTFSFGENAPEGKKERKKCISLGPGNGHSARKGWYEGYFLFLFLVGSVLIPNWGAVSSRLRQVPMVFLAIFFMSAGSLLSSS